jgi:glutamate-ammonia-ligase adenylyltransferase
VTEPLEARLAEAVAGSVLSERLATSAAPVIQRRSDDTAAARLSQPMTRGLARVLATQPEMAGFLSYRPALFERIVDATPDSLSERAHELEFHDAADSAGADDLEAALDALRVLRREETCFAACLDLGDVVTLEEVSEFLSQLAETITQRALVLAEASAAVSDASFAVLAMGKLAGREFTYHSDLDLIFLYEGGVDRIAAASKLGQRLIAYLTTMTGAGIAYPVDTRLRPSGHQGALVTSFEGFEHYETETAETWEHLALLRGRAVAGAMERGQRVLDRSRRHVLAHAPCPWKYIADLRQRVVTERGGTSPDEVSFKTGAGGLMDVDFLAGGALLERGNGEFPAYPSVASMLRTAAEGPGVERLLSHQRMLRIVEARARWVAGRGCETLSRAGEVLPVVAELVEPGLSGPALLERIAESRQHIGDAYDAVVEAGSISALA